MTIEGKQMNEGTSFKPSEPVLCANGCGFFGSAATMNLCSKCFRDVQLKEERKETAKKAFNKFASGTATSHESSGDLAVAKPSSSSSSDAKSPVESLDVAASVVNKQTPDRCSSCSKKVGLTGFRCRCGSTFCGFHRHPEDHQCNFDFKKQGRDDITKANPVVKADKIVRF